MPLLLSLAVFAVIATVFGLIVWFAAGIARVEEYRSDEDRRMIAAVKRLEHNESDQPSRDDADLPGMWSHTDFLGGDPDERSYAERSKQDNTDGPS